ncbi:MAG: hypothetical protein JOY99_05845 [Sphingomonadaceae bacterium]|nr:hypothetical protein [Sphingomonadaceae bacterium]
MPLPGESMSVPGYFNFELDETTRTLRVSLEGAWTTTIAEAFVTAHNSAADHCRREFGRLKMITDATRMPIPPQEVTAIINSGQKIKDGDRFAVVLETTLAKISARRHLQVMPGTVQWGVFISASAAETWLQAGS